MPASHLQKAQRILAQSIAREAGPKGIHVAYITIDAVIDLRWTRKRYRRNRMIFYRPDEIRTRSTTLCTNREVRGASMSKYDRTAKRGKFRSRLGNRQKQKKKRQCNLGRMAKRLCVDRVSKDLFPMTRSEAYRIQLEYAQRSSKPVFGWKIPQLV